MFGVLFVNRPLTIRGTDWPVQLTEKVGNMNVVKYCNRNYIMGYFCFKILYCLKCSQGPLLPKYFC